MQHLASEFCSTSHAPKYRSFPKSFDAVPKIIGRCLLFKTTLSHIVGFQRNHAYKCKELWIINLHSSDSRRTHVNDGFLAGEITTCMYPDHAMFDPSYKVSETEYKNKSNKVIVNNINNDNKVSILVHPQKIKKIKCIAYDESNSPLFQIEENINFELQKGTNLSLAFDITD